MNVIKINGSALPKEPQTYSITKSDLYSDSTGRSAETGKMIRYLIRKDVYSISLEYHGKDSEIAEIENLISANSLEVEFFENGSYKKKEMYVSDREKSEIKIINSVGRCILTFQLIEV